MAGWPGSPVLMGAPEPEEMFKTKHEDVGPMSRESGPRPRTGGVMGSAKPVCADPPALRGAPEPSTSFITDQRGEIVPAARSPRNPDADAAARGIDAGLTSPGVAASLLNVAKGVEGRRLSYHFEEMQLWRLMYNDLPNWARWNWHTRAITARPSAEETGKETRDVEPQDERGPQPDSEGGTRDRRWAERGCHE